MNRWTPAYIALGSNLGAEPSGPADRTDDDLAGARAQVNTALTGLAQLRDTRLVAHSRLYRSRPMGPQDQPDFVNAAAGLLTRLQPRALLDELQALERRMGRTPPSVRWGPRLIDLDLLLHGTARHEGADLTLPHPGLHERNFVLYPLAEIAPDLHIPGHGRVSALAHALGDGGLQILN
jgi:2-amino-4-hydroxy-6-hydroxymethyldihydropteridine diphosphokinase